MTHQFYEDYNPLNAQLFAEQALAEQEYAKEFTAFEEAEWRAYKEHDEHMRYLLMNDGEGFLS